MKQVEDLIFYKYKKNQRLFIIFAQYCSIISKKQYKTPKRKT